MESTDDPRRCGPVDHGALLRWWVAHHQGDLRAVAIASGVSRRCVQRWVRAGRLPGGVSHLVEQILNGPAVQRSMRFSDAVRYEWRELLGSVAHRHHLAARSRWGRALAANGWGGVGPSAPRMTE